MRDTEAEAREYAAELVSKLDDDKGTEIANGRWIAPRWGYRIRRAIAHWRIWKGSSNRICGPELGVRVRAAGRRLSGQPTRSFELEAYRKMGIRAFIFSGYPHIEECAHFGKLVMPHLNGCSLDMYGRAGEHTGNTTRRRRKTTWNGLPLRQT